MRKKGKKQDPEAAVADYWESRDATDELDFRAPARIDIIYQPPVKSISIRLPQPLLTELKRVAARMDVAYQALIKMWLSEKIKEIKPLSQTRLTE